MSALLGTSHKVKLSESIGVLTRVLYLAPARESGINTCQYASPGCAATCIKRTGMMIYPTHAKARVRKTLMFFRERPAFLAQLRKDIDATVRAATRAGMRCGIRLNGTSDLPWELTGIMAQYPRVEFYDYTKSVKRALASLTDPSWPCNYRLTFSRSETNEGDCRAVLAAGGNVAVVFADDAGKPSTFLGYPVFDGDCHDHRYSDPRNVVVALRAKGTAKKDRSGFVVR